MEDLVQLFRENGLTKFSSSDSGYRLCVQIPATFEVENEVDDDHRGMMRLKIRIFHLDVNRNGSFVSKQAAEAAMPTIKNRPVMAYIHQCDDGEWDFEAHNMTIETDENGNNHFEYQEKQVGSFDESEPFFEYDAELDKTFVCAHAYISEDYTRACDIIRRKGGTKNSVELSIEELAYNVKEGYIDLQKFYISASTLLGSYDDGTEVAEGMLGSRADIVDFSETNNSVLSDRQEFINEVTSAVLKQLSDKKAFAENSKEGGKPKEMDKFNKLLVKYNKTIEDVTFEYENMSDEELETAFASAFETVENSGASSSKESKDFTEEDNSEDEVLTTQEEETEEVAEIPEIVDDFEGEEPVDDPAGSESGQGDESDGGESEDGVSEAGEHQSTSVIEDEDSAETRIENSLNYSVMVDGVRKEFAVSLADKITAVTTLINDTYGETDNCWYWCDVYEDDEKYCIMHDSWSDRHFKQELSITEDVYSLKGDRVQVFAQYLTSDEIAKLDKMKSDFDSIESELNSYKGKELRSQREAILASEAYAVMKDFADFNELKEHMDDYSVEELSNKADLVYAKYMKANSAFAAKEHKNRGIVFMTSNSNTQEEKSPYGGLFKNFKSKKN